MILKADAAYVKVLSEIGAETFIDAHKDSAPAYEIERYVKDKYNLQAITNELENPKNYFHILKHENDVAGFSKMIFNKSHSDVPFQNVSKLDQIYLLNSFHGLKLGAKLLQFNIELSKANNQIGMWLVVWAGNDHSISFYEKFGFKTVAFGDFHLTDSHTSRCQIMFLKY